MELQNIKATKKERKNKMRVYLIGFMCSGKTIVGSLLASQLNYSFIDLDKEIEKKEGLNIPEIFSRKGESYFRKVELETLKEISEKDNVVISTGGGLGANIEALEFMKRRGKTVWIDIDFTTFLERCSGDKNRPLLKKPLRELKELFEKRKKVYRLADIKVKGENSPEEIVKEILLSLKGNSLSR